MTRLRIEQDGAEDVFVDVSPDTPLTVRFREPFTSDSRDLVFSLHDLLTIDVLERPVPIPAQIGRKPDQVPVPVRGRRRR